VPSASAGVFDVEGVIVGDDRVWRQAAFRWLDREDDISRAPDGDRGTYVMLLRPGIDRLTRSVLEGASACA
jgi:hypothetical protein